MNLFYAIWADAIHYERKKNGGKNHWKVFTFAQMSLLLSWNLVTFYMTIKNLTGVDIAPNVFLLFIHNKLVGNILWAVIYLFIPALTINYFFVFYKRRYRTIIRKYKFRNGKILLIYFIATVILFLGFALLRDYLLKIGPFSV